jgi:putative ABC transport system permease protein
MVDSLYTSLEDALLSVSEGRLVLVHTLTEIKADQYRDSIAMVQMLSGLSVLLVVVTSLGIIGLTSFSVTQRTHEIGTRRALGATRLKIVRYFLVENWLITTVGLSLGLAFAYGLNYALGNFAEVARIDFAVIGFGMLLLWAVGLLAALAPAIRGASVSPVTATKAV